MNALEVNRRGDVPLTVFPVGFDSDRWRARPEPEPFFHASRPRFVPHQMSIAVYLLVGKDWRLELVESLVGYFRLAPEVLGGPVDPTSPIKFMVCVLIPREASEEVVVAIPLR